MEVEFKCRFEQHENEPIIGFCLNKNCPKPSQFCYECLKQEIHNDHSNDCMSFNSLEQLISQLIQTHNELLTKLQGIYDQLKYSFETKYKQLESDILKIQEIDKSLKCQLYNSIKQQIPFVKDFCFKEKNEGKQVVLYSGLFLIKLKKTAETLKEKENHLKDSSYLAQLYQILGDQLFDQDMYKEAIILFDDSLNYDCNQSQVYNLKGKFVNFLVGMALRNLNHYQEALECFDQAIKINSSYSDALNNKGNALFNMCHYQAALQCYDQAIRINSNDSDACYNKGNTLFILNRYQDAIESYDQAIKINPNYIEAIYNKGIALFNLNRFQDAIECYDHVIAIDSNYNDAYYNKGIALFNLNRYQEALDCYDQATRINPNQSDAFYNKGNALYILKRYEEALECYNQSNKIDINDSDSFYNKGKLALYQQETHYLN
ncbi:unnamed protein product (macronuclear) [Paramecium tetraurelia]|uniref:Uncharacterized protein n=1 Tax=Paramecium tetraurelia TaxID=5888 RepID=A0DW75_PARTE|nr:uncharacterized protein GSPATT00020946001 [Paramecium tetraurelia]CAK87292.1 unnamed protein product [Paramecium tetraurelia]|eukprot:XP_001454689.1 hypothetical protein (macronuclear) [Paramecium tetraurelia strain d4-2]